MIRTVLSLFVFNLAFAPLADAAPLKSESLIMISGKKTDQKIF